MKIKILTIIAIIGLLVALIMQLLQGQLDPNRNISLHCYIRNVTIVFTIYYLINYKWSLWVFLLPFFVELILEILHTIFKIEIDPDENKTKNCYNWFEKVSRTDPELDYYTEGMYYNDKNISMHEAQYNKFDWMCKASNVSQGTRILDIGSGRCDFLMYAKNKYGAHATGCTISTDQIETCKKKDIDVFVTDITNDAIPEEYKGKFDVIVLNGSAEHFRQYCNSLSYEEFWNKFFNKISEFFDPNSNNKHVVITMIHFRRPQSPMEKVHNWFLDKGFGGSYPEGKYGLVKYLTGYKVLTMRDSTLDYEIYSSKWGLISQQKINEIKNNFLMVTPIHLILNPYYLHTFIAVLFSWLQQFKAKANGSPMLHQWIVLQAN